ncbi:hypothetical protein D3C79_905610 [compost metagenome]
MGQAGDDPCEDQRLVTRCLPRQQVAEGEQHHQRQQQQFARNLAGEGGQHRGADGNAKGIQAHQQAGGWQTDAEVGADGR